MCSDDQHAAHMSRLAGIKQELHTLISGRVPDWRIAMISDTQPWTMDYKGYKHVFLWIPGSPLTLNLGDFGTGLINNQQWINLGLPIGTNILTSGQATPVEIRLKFTDEVIA